jgi:alpha-L-rhamnosidase
MKVSFLISILMLSAMLGCSSPALSVIDPMTEGMHEPEALHTASPRLNWKIQSGKNEVMQESYRILAATSEDLLYEGKADLWDSGNVESGISVLIPYEGKEIESSSKVWWKVKVRTNIGTAESSPTWFRTGMLNSAEIKASWIGKEFEDDVLEIKTRLAGRMLRKEFNAGQDIQEAVLHISGQGLYKASINGHEVGSCDHLKPTPSDYSKTVYINTYDITEFIR